MAILLVEKGHLKRSFHFVAKKLQLGVVAWLTLVANCKVFAITVPKGFLAYPKEEVCRME
jgi:hypothetical protein